MRRRDAERRPLGKDGELGDQTTPILSRIVRNRQRSPQPPTLVRDVPEVWADHFDAVGAAFRRGFLAGRAVAR